MNEFSLMTGNEVDRNDAKAFLQRMFPPAKSQYLIANADWLYRGIGNQWFALSQDKIIGYQAVIPVDCAVAGKKVSALWLVDIVVDPDYRGRGVQTVLDKGLQATAELKLGFPNELAAKIHRKHRWGVREDGDILLLPLFPRQLKQIKQLSGLKRTGSRLAAAILEPAAGLWRRHLRKSHRPNVAEDATRPEAAELETLFERFKHQYPATIYRDAAYWQWRYFDAPYAQELLFFLDDDPDGPTHCLVARQLEMEGYRSLRLLDWFGDRNDISGLKVVVRQALAHAANWGAVQVTVMNFNPELRSFWRRNGFILRTTARFCWQVSDRTLMEQIGNGDHWVLGDSDNDAPE